MATTLPARENGAGILETLLASAVHTAAAANTAETPVTGLGCYQTAAIELILTDAKAAAGDTLDVFVDTSFDGGTTWVNAVHFTQIVGNGADAQAFAATLVRSADPGVDVVSLTADCAASKVRPNLFGDRLRVRHTIVDAGAHGQSFTFSVVGLFT